MIFLFSGDESAYFLKDNFTFGVIDNTNRRSIWSNYQLQIQTSIIASAHIFPTNPIIVQEEIISSFNVCLRNTLTNSLKFRYFSNISIIRLLLKISQIVPEIYTYSLIMLLYMELYVKMRIVSIHIQIMNILQLLSLLLNIQLDFFCISLERRITLHSLI